MVEAIATNVANLGLNLALLHGLFGLKQSVGGVAGATVIALLFGMLFTIAVVHRRLGVRFPRRTSFAELRGALRPVLGIGLHYREVSHGRVAELKTRFEAWAKELPATLKIAVAKMMFEVRPGVKWDKGSAVRTLLAELAPGAAIAYLGDDLTDEDAFHAIGDRGLRVLVRPEQRPSAADIWLRPPEELLAFLGRWARSAPAQA